MTTNRTDDSRRRDRKGRYIAECEHCYCPEGCACSPEEPCGCGNPKSRLATLILARKSDRAICAALGITQGQAHELMNTARIAQLRNCVARWAAVETAALDRGDDAAFRCARRYRNRAEAELSHESQIVDVAAFARRLAQLDAATCERAGSALDAEWVSAHQEALADHLGVTFAALLDEDVHAARMAYELEVSVIGAAWRGPRI